MSPKPPVCASGVHSELMSKMRLLEDAGAVSIGFRVVSWVVVGVSIALPALAADADASAIRTRAWGETAGGASFAPGFFFAAAGFFPAPALAEAGFSTGVVSAEGSIDAEILVGDLPLPDGDLAMRKTKRFQGMGKAIE